MNKAQEMVREFHEKFAQPIGGDFYNAPRRELRGKLILEEAIETADALDRANFPEVIDGLCDLIYVCYGAALEFGVDLEPYFNEVHLTNMMKDGGPTRLDGKILKPAGWKPPRIAEMLASQIGKLK